MALNLSPLVENFVGSRLTFTSSHSFDETVARLRRQTNPDSQPFSQPQKPYKPYIDMTQAEFVEFISSQRGPSGFMYFHELEFGSWVNLFDIGGGKRMKKFIVGNPLIAINILRNDERAALNVPIELLVRELDNERGVEIVYLKPEPVLVPDAADRRGEVEKAFLVLDPRVSQV
ncbi:hypothetical protein LTR70_009763 [Exophiala xenobiotica]|uniref:DUF302 domain-containing protein n=1 Tax=Lithohypha guttulata TaxID=1690604 RepID=A0ABR0JVP7_9EURO|nr:hypothetical protein LTR24_009886 [Lithohypha guttulata]KAK5310056.1 hypothetical protein LTR70_009763 [Exophiala xenobiotica]